MRYGFINNFSQLLAADLAAGATTLTLDGGGALLSAATADLVYTLTLDDGDGTTEIVHVTGQTTNDLTIVRAQEGTTAQAWSTGTPVEMRVTAAALQDISESFVRGDEGSIIAGVGAATLDPADSVIVVGSYAYGAGSNTIALGSNSTADAVRMVVVGANGQGSGINAVGVGHGIYCYGDYGSAFGSGADADGAYSLAAAYLSWATGSYSIAMGWEARTRKAESIAFGPKADADIIGGFACTALPYLPAVAADNVNFVAPNAARRAANQVVIATDPLDLTDAAAAVTLDLPTGTRLFMDSIDVIINGSDTPGGSPEISVGPDDVTPAAYLASTAVTKTAVGERQTHTPLVLDGVTSLRVATTVAGTGTTYQAKIVFRGYVMEL